MSTSAAGWWFVCPGCERRAGILYSDNLKSFLCRLCFSLAYPTQILHAPWRGQGAALKVRQRFDGSSISSPFPPRPRGMHLETYWRLYDKERKAAKVFCTFFCAQFERLIGGTNAPARRPSGEDGNQSDRLDGRVLSPVEGASDRLIWARCRSMPLRPLDNVLGPTSIL